jgi:penicillin-binding protein-related factor A (putative recombinase)
MKKVPKHAEILKAVRTLLRHHNIWHYKHYGGLYSSKGIADIIGIYQSRYLAIEVKRIGDKLSSEQEKFLKEVEENGGIALVAHSTEEVIKALHLPDLYNGVYGRCF